MNQVPPPAVDLQGNKKPLERILLRDRWIVLAALALIIIVAWIWLAFMANQMSPGDVMDTVATSQMSWSWQTFILMFTMWSVMMVGMMLPGAAPMILLFASIHRRKLADLNPGLRIAVFASGYLLVWLLFSLAATGLQWMLTELRLLSPLMEGTSHALGAGLLLAAGLYQLTPLKQACLQQCQSPLMFLTNHWKTGTAGAFAMGTRHGLFCVGCCWLLMALLFVGGVMNLIWAAALAAFVLIEKIAPSGDVIAKVSGGLLIAFAGYVALWA